VLDNDALHYVCDAHVFAFLHCAHCRCATAPLVLLKFLLSLLQAIPGFFQSLFDPDYKERMALRAKAKQKVAAAKDARKSTRSAAKALLVKPASRQSNLRTLSDIHKDKPSRP
jgi:hypothetical protein